MALNRYRNVNKKEIEDAKRFVLSSTKDKSKVASWVKRYADHLTVKDGKLLLDGRQVIGNDERDDLMRELVYKKNSDIAPSRDAGYYKVKKRYANVSRRNWMDFLKKQRVIRMTDNAPPKQKHGGRKLNKKGELECDLFYIGKDDLPKSLQSGTAEQTYALNVVDRLTSYCKVYFLGGTRTAKKVRPFLVKAVAFFAKLLNVEKKDMHMYHDGGGEFSDKNMDSLGVPHTQLEVGPKVEQKNSHVQRVFHRLKNSKRISSITDGLAQAEKIVNGSYNRIMKMSAEEAVKKYNDPEETKKLILKYNDQREKADLDRRADLSIGDYVRIVVKSTKESEFYKAYRGKTYTREGYPVNPKNKHLYKGRSVTKEAYEVTESKGKNPKRYKVDGMWFTRDRLSEPLPTKQDKDGKKKLDYPDKKTEELLEGRAAVDQGDEKGMTALMWASHKGHLGVARALLAAGARADLADAHGQRRPLLSEDEVNNLCIPRGTLTEEERRIINGHMDITLEMLESLPFPRKLRRVPEYAGGHHERMDGRGFPRGLTREQMSVPARIMAIADVFEALTSRERPYKAPLKLSEALGIMQRMRDNQHLDPDLYRLFLDAGVWRDYARTALDPEQLDVDDPSPYY